jgi:hypothetical protein
VDHVVSNGFVVCNYFFACFYEEQHLGAQFASVFALSNPNRPHKAVEEVEGNAFSSLWVIRSESYCQGTV